MRDELSCRLVQFHALCAQKETLPLVDALLETFVEKAGFLAMRKEIVAKVKISTLDRISAGLTR